jgi:Fe-S-cluster containining protein
MANGNSEIPDETWTPVECFRCGICCTFYRPRLTMEEIEHIARELGMPKEAFTSRYVRVVSEKGTYILRNDEDKCPFFRWDTETSKGACNIYSFRPQTCRSWVASLSRPECREGLQRLITASKLLLPGEIYPSDSEVERLYSAIVNDSETGLASEDNNARGLTGGKLVAVCKGHSPAI